MREWSPSLTHLFLGACLFLLAVVVPVSLFGEVGADLVFPKPVLADGEAVLRSMDIAENIKVVSSTENSDIFSALFEPINFIGPSRAGGHQIPVAMPG